MVCDCLPAPFHITYTLVITYRSLELASLVAHLALERRLAPAAQSEKHLPNIELSTPGNFI